MSRSKARENYGKGSVSAVKVPKLGKDGLPVVDGEGRPVMIQKKDRSGDPVWRVCVTLGIEEYVDVGGRLRKRQRKVQKTYHGTLADARSYRDALAEQYSSVDAERAGDTFTALYESWSRSEDLDCSEKKRKQYLRFLGYVAPYLDSKPLVELRKQDVNAALDKAMVRPDGRELAPSTARMMRSLVHRVFEYGVDEDYITANPCRVKRAKKGSTTAKQISKRRSLTEVEAATLCASLDVSEELAYREYADKEKRQADLNNTFGRSAVRGLSTLSNLIAVRLMLATGMRRGEALGMTWGNLNLEDGIARVSQTLNETMDLKEPKTDAGIRNLYLDSHTVEHLRRWKEFQAKALHLVIRDGVALSQDERTPVFCTDNGSWIDPTNCYRWWRDYRSTCGLDGLTLHELRHSQVTLLLGNGIAWEEVQSRVGHARPSSVTLTYLHELPARDSASAEVIGRILYGRKGGEGKVVSFPKTA